MEPERKKQGSDIQPDIRPNLRVVGDAEIKVTGELHAIQGGRQTTPDRPGRSTMRAVEDRDTTAGDLSSMENSAATGGNENPDSIQDQESDPDTSPGGWRNNFSKNDGNARNKKRFLTTVKNIAKKRGGIIGGVAALLVGGSMLAGFLGPANMLVNIMENFTDINDSTSTAKGLRFMKVLGLSTSDSDTFCRESTKLTIRCKAGKISNSALNSLSKKGITANFPDGVTNDITKKYPPRNPSSYTFTDGNTSTTVPANALPQYLADNPRVAAKVLGVKGAFNVKMMSWSGKFITTQFFDKFNLKKDGGLADGKNKKLSASERASATNERIKERLPDTKGASNVTTTVKGKAEKHLQKAGKGGAMYSLAVAGCLVPKAPIFIAAGVAAIELAPVLIAVNDLALSPASRMKASGVDAQNAVTADDIDAVSSLYTDKYPDAESGRMLSAMDSPILQSAMGVNKSKVTVSDKYTPGLSYLTSKTVVDAININKAAEPACNAIMSPAAMYTAMAVDSAATIALSTTIVGGIAKAAASTALDLVIPVVAGMVFESVATAVIDELANSEKYSTAKGKELGDVIGIGAMAFFSSGAMASSVPGLKMSQLNDFAALKDENDAFNRDMDIASLSPFDTSSKYTFLGSIVNNMKLAVIQSGGYSGNPLSLIPLLSSLPSSFRTASAGASGDFTQEYCGYADEFELSVGSVDGSIDANATPAINAAGLPCTGLTREQAAMTSEEAIDLVMSEGWVTEDEIESSDTITDLMDKGVIKEGTPLTDFIEACSDPSTGDYLFNASGCTTEGSSVKSPGSLSGCYKDDQGIKVCLDPDDANTTEPEVDGVDNPRALSAISVFLLDYQINSAINGEDEPVFGSGEDGDSVSDSAYTLPVDPGYMSFNHKQDWGERNICTSNDPNSHCKFHRGVDFAGWSGGTDGKPVYSVAEGEVVKVGLFNTSCSITDSGDLKMDNQVLIKHKDGTITGYSHMTVGAIQATGIKVGDTVKAGQQIGAVGNCGNSGGAHLHFTVSPGETTRTDILSIDSNTRGGIKYLNPSAYMALYGVDL